MPVKDGEEQWREFADFATLEKLLEVGQSLIVVRDLGALLQKIAESAGAVLGADVIVLYEYHEEAGDVTVPPVIWGDIWHPEVPMGRGRVRPHRESAVFKMLERTEPFYASDAREDWVQLIEEWSREEGSAGNFVYREGIVSSAAVPLIADAERVGMLFVNYRTHHAFPDKERKTIELFATQAAIAIQNARLLADLQRQVKGHRALNSVGAKLAGMLDEETILNCVARSAADTLDCTHCSVFRIEAGELVVVAAEGNRARSLQPGRTFKLGQGVAGWVAQNGQPALVPNTLEDERFDPGWSKPQRDPQSLVVVPIFLGGKVYGVISAEQDRVGAFDEQDQRLIETLALQASQAVQNARLLQQEQTLRQQAETLREVSGAISSALELREVAGRILDGLGKVVEYRKASMQLIQDDTRTLIAYRGFKGKKFDEWLLRPISQDRLISRIVESKKPLILSDPSEDDDWEIRPETADVKSWLGLPLVYRGEAIGLLTLDHDQSGFYTQALEGLLVSFANQAAIAIGNARLFGDAERRIRDLGIVNEVVQVMSTKLDIQDLSQTIVSQIADKLNCTDCTLFLLQEEDGEPLLVPRVTNGERSEQIMRRRFKPDEGLAGVVFKEGKSLVLDDARKSPDFARATYPQARPRSMLVAPVRVGDRTIGVISADQDEYGWFSESDRHLLDALARQAGIAIERTTALALLQDIGNQIISAQELDDILRNIVAGAIELTHTTSGTIYLISEDGKSVTDSFLYPPDFDHPPPRLDREEGITHQVIETGEIQVFPDIKQDDRINPALHDLGIRSMIAIPLKLEEQVIGVLYLNDSDLHDFTETEVSLLSTLASQAASAIESARLYQTERTRATQLAVVNQVARRAASILELDQLLQETAAAIQQSFNYYHVGLFLLDEVAGELKMRAIAGRFEDVAPPDHRLALGEGMVGWTAESGQPLLANDVSQEPRYVLGILKEALTQSELCVPLKLAGKVMGVLDIQSSQLNAFDETDLMAMETLADLIAAAVGNAALFEQRKALQEIARDITSVLDVDKLLNETLKRSLELLGCPVGSIAMLDKKTGELVYRYAIGKQVGLSLPVDKGLMTAAAQTRQPVRVGDVTKDPRYVEHVAETRSELDVPLLVGDELVGVLNAESPLYGAFSEEDERVAITLASQAAVVLHNAALFERRRALVEFGQAVTSGMRLREDEVLELIYTQATKLMDTDNMYVALYDEATDTVRFGLAFVDGRRIDVTTEEGWQPRKEGKGRTEEIIRTKEPIFIATKAEAEAWYREPGRKDYLTGAMFPSWLGVPMMVGEKVVGIIATYHPTQDYVYSGDDLAILQAMADQAAIALDNAHMFYDVNRRLEALVEFGQAVASGLRLREDEVLELVFSQASRLMDTDNMYIALYDGATDTVRFGLAFVDGRPIDVAMEEGWQPRKAGKGRTEEIIRTKRPIFHAAGAEARAWYGQPGHEEYVGQTFGSWIGVPMLVGERVLGVIATYHPTRDYVYSGDDLVILQAIASQAAIALNEARVYTAWQQEQERRIEAERLGYLGSMAAVLAHRIGNKGGMVRRCVKDLYPLVDQKNNEIMDNLQTLERNNEFLLTMSEELLKPSKAASVPLERLDVNMLLEEALDHADIPPEIEVSTKLADELPFVLANRWLVDVFLELISNAVKAMTDSPMRCLEIGSRPGKEFLVKVWCTDTGHGIAEDKQDAIFEMFHTDAEEEGHHGFGLWWIKTFITKIGGEIDFESELDKGTTFVVKLGRLP